MLDNIRIVLVHTTHPGNIGATARAMMNMGLKQLYLVSPKQFPSPKAIWRASGAVGILDNAMVVEDLQAAIQDCSLVIGTSSRERRIPWPLFTPRECAPRIIGEAQRQPVAIVFGREAMGLTNEELHQCHWHLTIPANPQYSVLNIAAAVQVVAYELFMAMQENAVISEKEAWDFPYATAEETEGLFNHLQQMLVDIDFLDPHNPRQLMTRLRRLFLRCRLDQMEVNILRGILAHIQKLRS